MFWRKKTDTEQINAEKDIQRDAMPERTERHHARAVVNGKLYDTEKSECLAYIGGRYLFKTQNGNYFSCATQYYKCIRASGVVVHCFKYFNISPESIEGAKNAIGKYNVDKYIELFGEPEPA